MAETGAAAGRKGKVGGSVELGKGEGEEGKKQLVVGERQRLALEACFRMEREGRPVPSFPQKDRPRAHGIPSRKAKSLLLNQLNKRDQFPMDTYT